MKAIIASSFALLLSTACVDQSEPSDPTVETEARVQGPAHGPTYTGAYKWSGWNDTSEFFMLNNECLAVPKAAFPNPPPTAGQQCVATGCVPDPRAPNCFNCTTLTCGPTGY
jgi:hypothetical protein